MKTLSVKGTQAHMLSPEEYERRCEAFEAEGLARSDAQGQVDMEELYPSARQTAHGLPPQLAAAGYRIEFGSRDLPEAALRGRWWWTFTAGGDVETPAESWPTPHAAVAHAQNAFDEGYHLVGSSWANSCETAEAWAEAQAFFGLDASFQYSKAQIREYIRMLRLEQNRPLKLEALLRELRHHIVFDDDGPLTRTEFEAMLKRVDDALGG